MQAPARNFYCMGFVDLFYKMIIINPKQACGI